MSNQMQGCDICGETIVADDSSRVSVNDMKKAIEQGLNPQYNWSHVWLKCKNLESATGINLNEFHLSWKRTIERSSEVSPDLFLCAECRRRFRDYQPKQPKVPCTKCGAKILQATAQKTDGLCMRCYKKEKEGCFIATVCYGSLGCPEVLIFRRFRDKILLPSRLGLLAVNLYYNLSPPLAKYLYHKPKLRNFIRRYFLNPIVRVLRFNDNNFA